MKEDKAISTHISAHENGDAESAPCAYRGVLVGAFLLVLIFAIGFRIYKADFAGITYDERANFKIFASSLYTAVNFFTTTNNHVLNSVLMYYAHKYCSFYEHFIRIPSLLAGILFTLSVAYIVHRTVISRTLRIAALAMITLTPFVVDYSFMARGYAYALGACFAQIALVLWLMEHKIRYWYWPVPVLMISLMNFMAFGAMLSSALILAAFNLTFVLFYSNQILRPKDIHRDDGDHQPERYSHRVKRIHRKHSSQHDPDVETTSLFAKKWFPILLNTVTVFLVSSGLLYLLYRNIYNDILNSHTMMRIGRRMKGWPGFITYLKNLLVTRVFVPARTPGNIILTVILVLLAMAIVFLIFRFCRAVKAGQWRRHLAKDDPAVLIFIVTGLTLIFMFIQCVMLHKGLGLARNQVFFIPLVLLCGLIVLDRFGRACGPKMCGHIIRTIIVLTVLAATLHNFPSPYHIARQGMCGPLLRKLRAIDPERTWKIGFIKETENRSVGFWYYKRNLSHKYKFNILMAKHANRADLIIYPSKTRPQNRAYFDWKFFEPQGYVIVVNDYLPTDKIVYSACLVED